MEHESMGFKEKYIRREGRKEGRKGGLIRTGD